MNTKCGLGLLACLWLSSCATWSPQDGLEVSLVNVRFTEATVFETTIDFVVRIQNETPEGLVLDGGVHKIFLNGVYVGSGVTHERLEVPRLDSVKQTIAVHLRNLALIRRIRGMVESRAVDYRLDSVLYAVVGNRSARCRRQAAGRLDFQDFQPRADKPPQKEHAPPLRTR